MTYANEENRERAMRKAKEWLDVLSPEDRFMVAAKALTHPDGMCPYPAGSPECVSFHLRRKEFR